MPVFWGYPPLPHDYPHYWVLLDPKSKKVITWDTPSDAMMICAKYGKNASRIVDFFQGESRKIRKIRENLKFYNFVINLTRDTPSNGSDYLWQIWK